MSKLSDKLKMGLLVSSASVFSLSASAQESSPVADAVSSFSSTWGTNAALVGGALIAAAFLAIGFKWVKGMVFS